MGDEKLGSRTCEWGASQVRQEAPRPRQQLIKCSQKISLLRFV